MKPITAPPLNATGKALIVPPSLAASVVLPFAAVAILIPINPARDERSAPATKAADPQGYPQSVSTEIKTANITTKTLIHEYILFKNAIDPSLIAVESSSTLVSVTLIDKTLFAKNPARTSPAVAAIIEFSSI